MSGEPVVPAALARDQVGLDGSDASSAMAAELIAAFDASVSGPGGPWWVVGDGAVRARPAFAASGRIHGKPPQGMIL
jgi:hypothetical protein